MVIKDIKIFHSMAFQNVPKLGGGVENKPSGNPAHDLAILNVSYSGLKI
jgi:hypothetical protein